MYNTIQSFSISPAYEAETDLCANLTAETLWPSTTKRRCSHLNMEWIKKTLLGRTLREFSVWLSWKGAPLISVLPAFAPQEGWPPVYAPPSPPLPGPWSRCRRQTGSKCQSICKSVMFTCCMHLSLLMWELVTKMMCDNHDLKTESETDLGL